jgi:hypothetical protein
MLRRWRRPEWEPTAAIKPFYWGHLSCFNPNLRCARIRLAFELFDPGLAGLS